MAENVTNKKTCNIANSFNIVVNLYIIREIFYYLNSINSKKYQLGDFYSIMDINKGLYDKICEGKDFHFPDKRVKYISDKFGIDDIYFKRNGKIIDVLGLDINDWKYYFMGFIPDWEENNLKTAEIREEVKNKFSKDYTKRIANFYSKEDYEYKILEDIRKERTKEVNDKLNMAFETYTKYGMTEVTDELYSIYHYLKFKERYNYSGRLAQFVNRLEKMRISDWSAIKNDKEALTRYSQLLFKNSQYVQSLLITLKYETEDN